MRIAVWPVALLCSIASFHSFSVSITTSRLFLEPSKRLTGMSVYNTEAVAKTCVVSLKDVTLTSTGLTLSNGSNSLKSPKRSIRLAPSKFDLEVRNSQAFKVIYRRTPGVEPGEYIGVVAIKCQDRVNGQEGQAVSIKPTLVHNIPLIVRTGSLPAAGKFLSVKREGNQVVADFSIEGERSVTGDFYLYDTANKKVLAEKKKVSVYSQWSSMQITLPLEVDFEGDLGIAFKEIDASGSLTVEYDIR